MIKLKNKNQSNIQDEKQMEKAEYRILRKELLMESKWSMTIKIDPVKASQAGYDQKDIEEAVDEICKKSGAIKRSRGVYAGRGDNKDCSIMALIVGKLRNAEWFQQSVELWQMVTPNEVDDMIQFYRSKGYSF